LAKGAIGPLVEFEAGLLDVGRENLEVFHARCGICWRSNGELKGVECAVGPPKDTEKKRWCGLAVDLVGGGGLESHYGLFDAEDWMN
jgi:hypothetical protein